MSAPDDVKPCESCDGDGLCPMCQGEGFTECCCECGDWHDRDCEECRGDTKCVACDGSGLQAVTDLDRENAGQLSALGGGA